MLKILSIGNRFSEDAQRYLHGIAESFGKKIYNENICIEDSSLEDHYNNMISDSPAYKLIRHGVSTSEMVSIKEALEETDWDYVTLQQVSTRSFVVDSYYPFVKELSAYVRKYAPGAKILLHETWSYEKEKLPKKFTKTRDMFSRIERITRFVANDIGAHGVIPAGEALERLKDLGYPVHSDGKHASKGLGRYALALTWCEYLFGIDSRECTFSDFDVDVPKSWAESARECVHKTIEAKGACYCPFVTSSDVSYDEFSGVDNDRQKMDIYFPEKKDFPVFLYFHGGGFVKCSKDGHDMVAKYFTDRGIAFCAANYRMYPSAHYPDFIWDGAAAIAWLKKKLPDMGGNGKIFVGGTSAGGYLSMMLCFDRRYLRLYDMKPTDITAFIHDAGQPTTHFNVMRERGFDRKRVAIDDAAPIYYIGDSESYPPMLFTEASHDLRNRKEQTDLLFSTLLHFGYSLDNIERYTFSDSTHSSYVKQLDEDGESRFGKVVYPFIKKYL